MKPASLRPFLPRPAIRRRCRPYATSAAGGPSFEVFNDRTKLLQRDRAGANFEQSRKVDYLRDEVASRLCDRLLDIQRHFPTVLDLGANACNIGRRLTLPPNSTNASDPSSSSSPSPSESPPLISRISALTSADSSETLLHRDASLPFNDLIPNHQRVVLPQAPAPLPFAPQSFSAVLSSLSLHWVNDLPATLSQIATILKPDSPFIAAMLGGDSLYELRTSLQLADLDRRGGVSTHVSPLADVRDVGSLLTRAGFRLLTVDVDDIVVDYPDTFALMTDLQAMGESNASLTREPAGLRRDVMASAEAIYRELHGNEEDGKKTIPATFRIIYMIGWTEGADQPKPMARGSGQVNLQDVLGGGGDPGKDKK